MIGLLRPWLQLVKISLCLPIASSAALGAILHTPVLSKSLGLLFFGVLMLACGAAGYNSVQEVAVDGLFRRTRQRPLVTGTISTVAATAFSILLSFSGLLILWLATRNWPPVLLGLAAWGLYNGVYTPLKAASVFALLPGGLAGALPPLIGWTGAGGSISDAPAWMLFALFFLWQIPHYCLILLCHQQDYCTVDRPTLVRFLPEISLRRITLIWMLACMALALPLAFYPGLLAVGGRVTFCLMVLVMGTCCLGLGRSKTAHGYRVLFLLFNGSFFAALLIVALMQILAAI